MHRTRCSDDKALTVTTTNRGSFGKGHMVQPLSQPTHRFHTIFYTKCVSRLHTTLYIYIYMLRAWKISTSTHTHTHIYSDTIIMMAKSNIFKLSNGKKTYLKDSVQCLHIKRPCTAKLIAGQRFHDVGMTLSEVFQMRRL